MPRALVDPHHRFLVRAARQTKDLAALRVQPRPLEVDVLVLFDREIRFVRGLQLLSGDTDEPLVNVLNFGIVVLPIM